MNITYCPDYQSMSQLASSLVLSEIRKKKNLLFCAATGNSPAGLYQELANKSSKDQDFFKEVRIIKLDEWGGVPLDHPSTCENFLKRTLSTPLKIPTVNYISFSSDPIEPALECERIQSELDRHGPIDICVLGLGRNGHLGLNEPGQHLESHCHVAALSDKSLEHSMLQGTEIKPSYGLTLGMQDILASRLILFLVSGTNKALVLETLLQQKVSPTLPASYLWTHQNVECIINQSDFQESLSVQ